MLAIIIIGFLLFMFGWLFGEAMGWPLLSVPCALVLMVAVGVMAYGMGRLGASLDTTIAISESADQFFDASAQALESGNADRVHDELLGLSDELNWTKESGAFKERLDESTKRLGQSSYNN